MIVGGTPICNNIYGWVNVRKPMVLVVLLLLLVGLKGMECINFNWCDLGIETSVEIGEEVDDDDDKGYDLFNGRRNIHENGISITVL